MVWILIAVGVVMAGLVLLGCWAERRQARIEKLTADIAELKRIAETGR